MRRWVKTLCALGITVAAGFVAAACLPDGGSSSGTDVQTTDPVDPEVLHLKEADADEMGAYAVSNNYAFALAHGAKVVELPHLNTFFTLWVPPTYTAIPVRRVLVSLHGTGGTAYEPIRDELDLALLHGYAVVGVQWRNMADKWMQPSEVYQAVDLALRYMEYAYGADHGRAGFVGFSRGATIAYEVSYLDRTSGNDHLALYIPVSGGYHFNNPKPFWVDVEDGVLGKDVFFDRHFFFYCGQQDAEWGPDACLYSHAAENMVQLYGGVVEGFLDLPTGGHGDYFVDPVLHEAGINVFLWLTR